MMLPAILSQSAARVKILQSRCFIYSPVQSRMRTPSNFPFVNLYFYVGPTAPIYSHIISTVVSILQLTTVTLRLTFSPW